MSHLRMSQFSIPSRRMSRALVRIRADHQLSLDYPEQARNEAIAAVKAWQQSGVETALAHGWTDARHLPFVTIDPRQSRDLDQALYIQPADGGGWTIYYAIASLATFVKPGGALDKELWKRGETVYTPDQSVPLHPIELSHGAASLLPGQDCPSCLWTIELNAQGEPTDWTVEHAIVRNRLKLSYDDVQYALDTGEDIAESSWNVAQLLREVGQVRRDHEHQRGGISLNTPEQIIERRGDGDYVLHYRASNDAEQYNAQISLLTGMCAARMMCKAGIGLLRTMPPAQESDLHRLRTIARGLGVTWPQHTSYPDLVRSLDASKPAHAAFLAAAVSLFRGAGYTPLGLGGNEQGAHSSEADSSPGENGGRESDRHNDAGQAAVSSHGPCAGEEFAHSALASVYTHATAPLRRLVDRFTLETCVAIAQGSPVEPWVREGIERLPEVMASSTRKARSVERDVMGVMEALILDGHRGEVFRGTVTRHRGDGGEIVIAHPAVIATVEGDNLPVGHEVDAVLHEVDVEKGRVRFRVSSS